MLFIALGQTSGFLYKDGKVNVTGTFLLTCIASKTGKESFIKYQLILKAHKRTLNHHARREGRVIFGDGTYTGTFATFQAVVSLGFLNNIL
jgi:hypothetical protein